jgi:fatty-acyl-CoA synthase
MRARNTVVHLIEDAVATVPSRPAVISLHDDRQATYRELDLDSNRLAHALLGLGLRKGDRIGFWLQSSLPHVELYIAAAKAGLIAVPVNERYVAREVALLLEDCQARALVFGSFAAGHVASLDLDDSCLLVSEGAPAGNSVPLETLYEASDAPVDGQIGPADPFILGYTSGTTGRPKGAVLTHGGVVNLGRTNIMAQRIAMGSIGAYTAAMTFTATVPAFILAHFQASGTVVLCPSRAPEEVLEIIERYQCTYTHVPPPLVDEYADAIRKHPRRADSLVSILQGAGKVAADKLGRLNDAVAGRLIIAWGMTENSGGLISATSPAQMRRAFLGDPAILDSVGAPVPGARVTVLGEDDGPLPSDGASVGQLVVTSTSLMDRYWNRPEATAAALSGGWYSTGDMGTLDPDGNVRIVERRTDLIVSGGMNVYPTEVESVLLEFAGVRECAVVAVRDPRWGESVGAYIVAQPGAAVDAGALLSFCRMRMASFKKPTRIAFGPEIPRTLSGKVQRFKVRELLEAAPNSASTAQLTGGGTS